MVNALLMQEVDRKRAMFAVFQPTFQASGWLEYLHI